MTSDNLIIPNDIVDEPMPDTAPFSVVVTYHSNIQHLVAILINLQAQLLPPKRIIVIDTSTNKSGLDVAQKFNTGNSEIIVECAEIGIYEAWNRGIELAGGDDVLICNDDILLPINTMDLFLIAKVQTQALAYVPLTVPREHMSNSVSVPYSWFGRIPERIEDYALTTWMSGFCFYLTRKLIDAVGVFDTNYKVWFGDDDYQARILQHGAETNIPGIIKLNTCFVYHYGGKSYKYQSKDVQGLIEKDRDYFAKKHGLKKGDLLDVAK